MEHRDTQSNELGGWYGPGPRDPLAWMDDIEPIPKPRLERKPLKLWHKGLIFLAMNACIGAMGVAGYWWLVRSALGAVGRMFESSHPDHLLRPGLVGLLPVAQLDRAAAF
jgi:hypothetical protein